MNHMKVDKTHQAVESLLKAADWSIQDHTEIDFKKSLGVAVRDFPLARAYGKVDYLLFLEGRAVGVIEFKTEDRPLDGIPIDSEKYSRGLPFTLRLFTRPLPFLYQSSGFKTCFTNVFDPLPKPRNLTGFYRPETLSLWIEDGMVGETPRDMAAEYFPEHRRRGRSFQERLMINMPKLETAGLSPEQHKAITNVEISLSENRRRSLIEMASGLERTIVVTHMIERLLKFADARCVLILVQSTEIVQKLEAAIKEHLPTTENIPFTQTFPLQDLREGKLASDTRLCITSLSDLHSFLTDQDALNEEKGSNNAIPIRYNPSFPIESFEVIILELCDTPLPPHFQGTLEYFDTYLIGLTEKASQAADDFFEQNLVMQYKNVKPVPDPLSDGLNMISS